LRDLIPTILLALLPIAFFGAVCHTLLRHTIHTFPTLIFFWTVGGAVAGTLLGGRIAKRVSKNSVLVLFLTYLIGIGLKMTGAYTLLGISITLSPPSHQWLPYALFTLGMAAGAGSPIIGVGGGAVLVPGLTGLASLPFEEALGLSLLIIFPIAAISAWVRFDRTLIRTHDLKALLPLSVAGAVCGSMCTLVLPVKMLAFSFGIFLFYCAWSVLPPEIRLSLACPAIRIRKGLQAINLL
jgi:uncharacterized membrane protein YfcA